MMVMVGAARFELATPCTPCRCATGLRYAPPRRSHDSTIVNNTQRARRNKKLPAAAGLLTMMQQNCYSILGVPRTATTGEIRAAYRRLARMYHPDLNSEPEAEARMKEINEAYQVLSDPGRRFHHDAEVSGVGRQRRQYQRREGRGRAPAREYNPRQGEDIEVSLLISQRAAARGERKSFPVSRMETCPRCRGSGVEPEETAEAGVCWRCAGEQRLHRELRLNATIPAGVADGSRLRLRGQGNAGLDGGPGGNIYITVRIMPGERFGQALSFLLRHLLPG